VARDQLLVFDVDHFRYQLYHCIDKNGGYFLLSLLTSGNLRIVGVYRR